MRGPCRVGYILRAFPKLSETFILSEILALKARGVEVHVVALERCAERRRHPEAERLMPEVTFIPQAVWNSTARRRAPMDQGNGTGRIEIPRKSVRYWRAGAWAGAHFRRLGITHIHAHFAGPPATMAAAASEVAKAPFSFTAHAKDIFVEKVDWTWLRAVAGRARAVVTVCRYNRRYLVARMPGARVELVYNGVDLEIWNPGRQRPDSSLVVAVGRLVPKKGFHVLVEAMGLLQRWKTPARAVIVGDGKEKRTLEALIRKRGLGRSIWLLGPLAQPEVAGLLPRARVVAMPSVVCPDGNQDALPTVLLEAGACGVPAVATRVAGIPEIVRHKHTGYIVAPGNATVLARAIKQVIESDVLHARMSREARRWIAQRFDQRKTAAALQRIFVECSVARPAPRREKRVARRLAVR